MTHRIVTTFFYYFKKARRAALRGAIQLNGALNRHKYRYVFVLAHMRSGSTLLSHILASDPNFVRAGESFISYKTLADLQNLIIETSQRLRNVRLSATYVVDQVTLP